MVLAAQWPASTAAMALPRRIPADAEPAGRQTGLVAKMSKTALDWQASCAKSLEVAEYHKDDGGD